MKVQQFYKYIQDADRSVTGWDFSFITGTGRMQSQLLPWSFGSLVLPYIRNVRTMLDMGTGGGEFLSKLQPFPETTYATEGYPPNVAIAKERLEPLGVKVVQITEDTSLPFQDQSFDLVINQHESYCPKEVRRILVDKGSFITQQVGGLDCIQLNKALDVPLNQEYADWNLEMAFQDISQNGFRVKNCKEDYPLQRFYDIGAVVYYLKAVPWQVTDFQAENHLEKLYDIHRMIEKKGYFDARQHRFIIEAEAE